MTLPVSGVVSEVMVTAGAPMTEVTQSPVSSSFTIDGMDRGQRETKPREEAPQALLVAGVSSIPVDVPAAGKGLRLLGSLLIGEAPSVLLDLKPEKKK